MGIDTWWSNFKAKRQDRRIEKYGRKICHINTPHETRQQIISDLRRIPGEKASAALIKRYDLTLHENPIKDETEKSPQYRISGPYTVMKQLLEKKLDPVKAMMTGKLKVKGNMGQIMRMPRAALEFTNCLSKVDAVFPE